MQIFLNVDTCRYHSFLSSRAPKGTCDVYRINKSVILLNDDDRK
jgi:hypothetical protein